MQHPQKHFINRHKISKRILSMWFGTMLIFSQFQVHAQESKYAFSGYLTGMPQMLWNRSEEMYNVLFHNRMNFHYYPTDKITTSIQFRNQLLVGDFVEQSSHKNGFQKEGYFLPLTYKRTLNDNGLAYLAIDRLWLQYTLNNLEIKVGRQRVNWSQTFAWNPNDIFNSYNFFDFDYVERPGTDAVRLQYYPNYTSTIDVAVKIDSADNITMAGLYRINQWGFDFQFIAGYYTQPETGLFGRSDKSDKDWVGGVGFTTDFKGISIRGEATYFSPASGSANNRELFLSSIGLDYTFSFDLYAATEFFHASVVNLPMASGSMLSMYTTPMTVKTLAYAKDNAFAQLSYPITPLLNASISGMYFKDNQLKGYYISPSIDYSLLDNLEAAVYLQFFQFELNIWGYEAKLNTNFAFLRLKWSF